MISPSASRKSSPSVVSSQGQARRICSTTAKSSRSSSTRVSHPPGIRCIAKKRACDIVARSKSGYFERPVSISWQNGRGHQEITCCDSSTENRLVSSCVRSCAHARMCARVCVSARVHECMHARTYTHMHTNTCTIAWTTVPYIHKCLTYTIDHRMHARTHT